MNEVALEKEIKRIANELRLSGELADSRFVELKAEVDRLKLDIASLIRFLEQTAPSFAGDFPVIREKILQEVNPELS